METVALCVRVGVGGGPVGGAAHGCVLRQLVRTSSTAEEEGHNQAEIPTG